MEGLGILLNAIEKVKLEAELTDVKRKAMLYVEFAFEMRDLSDDVTVTNGDLGKATRRAIKRLRKEVNNKK